MVGSFDAAGDDVPLDIGLILTVALLLVAIHVLIPESTQGRLAFDHAAFNPLTLLTSAYVHNSTQHLTGNVVGYLLAVVYAYLLSWQVGERRWFRRSFLACLVILPVLVSLTSYAILQLRFPTFDPVSRGFSGVVAGFGGVLFVALYLFLQKRFDSNLAGTIAISVVLLLLVEVDTIFAGTVRPLVAGLAGVGVILSLLRYGRADGLNIVLETESGSLVAVGVTVLLTVVVLSWLVVGLFPATLVAGGAVTNIIAHAAGFLYGGGLAVPIRMYID